jgi:hypothetical protein
MAMERLMQQEYGFQNDANTLRDQLKEDDKLKVTLNVWSL